MATFNSDQAVMAIFLLMCTFCNLWFIYTSCKRAFGKDNKGLKQPQNDDDTHGRRYKLLTYSVVAMALFDVPWVWLCTIQCWNNTFTEENSFHQSSGDDSPGCTLMGFYSTFSLTSMMGSHCVVAYYLLNMIRSKPLVAVLDSVRGLVSLCLLLLIVSVVFASMPLIQGEGYRLTNGGFCYADFTNSTQATAILSVVLIFLTLSAVLWWNITRTDSRFGWLFYGVFFMTWILWIPAASVGIASATEISSPYMLIGAIVGHGTAIVNPILYGIYMFQVLRSSPREEDAGKSMAMEGNGSNKLLQDQTNYSSV